MKNRCATQATLFDLKSKTSLKKKIKQKASDAASPEFEKVGPIYFGKSVELEEASEQEVPEKAKILFSLKDFFERSSELQNNEDKFSSDEDEDKGKEDNSSDLDKNVESLYNDGKEKSEEDDDSDIISDSDATKSVKDSISEKGSDIEDTKEDEPDESTDLESEFNLLEKLKQKLDDNMTGTLKKSSKDESVVIFDEMNKESVPNKQEGDVDQEAEKEREESNSEASCTDPINNDDDNNAVSKGTQNTNKDKVVKSMFKNISISLVGSKSKTIDLETLLKKPPTKSSPPKQTTNVFQKPNISVKRKTAGSPDLVLGR